MTTPTPSPQQRKPRKRRTRYSANAVVRKEAELMNVSPEFGVAFFFNLMNRVVSSAMVNGECWIQASAPSSGPSTPRAGATTPAQAKSI